MSHSQVAQDLFVLSMLKNKEHGTFVEIGSNDPIRINNSFILEKYFCWSGIMIELDLAFLPSYKEHRPKSHHVISDATTIDYRKLFESFNMPKCIDYLQIDLEVVNESTRKCLQRLDEQVLDDYKFATITFEHDIYRGDFYSTRKYSRDVFTSRGYKLIFGDISDGGNAFEDWWIHPDLVSTNLELRENLEGTAAVKYFPVLETNKLE